MLWCAHKAYIRSILLQMSARLKKQRTIKIDNLIEDIRSLESQNKTLPDVQVSSKLTKLRSDLRRLLLERYDTFVNALRLTHYSAGNRAGKFLAQRLKDQKTRSRIPFLPSFE